MNILLLADIHSNYPALAAIDQFFSKSQFDLIINCGDSTVYGPFPNETLAWLKKRGAFSILGNTDRKVIKLIKGKTFKKPRKPEKRVMYTWTYDILNDDAKAYLLSQKKKGSIDLSQSGPKLKQTLHLFHGSPDDPDEFLFSDTDEKRFRQLAKDFSHSIIVIGHSHSPFYKTFGTVSFINPGSIGRMFDGNPAASCATITINQDKLDVQHYRIPYPIEEVVEGIRKNGLPEIYATMYKVGKKLN